ncbi:MAG: tryptophan 2,3-dioxygenase family protein [Bacteroidota bacterium]
MDKAEISSEVIEKIKELQKKYEASGQDMLSYLEGLLHADYLNYWDYIHIDTLLSLQNPRTDLPDEEIFIIYHQITELYFKLALNELKILTSNADLTASEFLLRIKRVISYFQQLVGSFSIMSGGMSKDEFLKFRMALLPASGFQSAQFRYIEINSTSMINLVCTEDQKNCQDSDAIENLFENIYWSRGATELATGLKTLTLKQFEEKYNNKFISLGKRLRKTNLQKLFQKHFSNHKQKEEIITELRSYDELINVHWRLAHLKSAVSYLQKRESDIAATGGTNWQKYLPPSFQKVIFFPELWSKEEKQNWGRTFFTL